MEHAPLTGTGQGRGISVVDSLHVYCLWTTRLTATSDGGATWAVREVPTQGQLLDVDFVTPLLGWVVGFDGEILKTTDGGVTWVHQRASTYRDLNGVCFVDSQEGWAAGANGVVIRTTNGGQTWAKVSVGASAKDWFSAVPFLDGRRGWIVGCTDSYEALILKTADGGKTWTREASASHQVIYDVSFSPDGSFGVAVGELVDKGRARAHQEGIRATRSARAVAYAWREDTRAPRTAARTVTAQRNRRVKLRYRVADAAPTCGRANVQVRVYRGSQVAKNKLVKKSPLLKRRLVNRWLTWSFVCKLPPGRYTVAVDARDLAGNKAKRRTTARLTVR